MAKKNGIFAEFKKFITRGNVIDLAVGVIIGAAFQAIVNSLVNDLVMPLVGLLTGGMDFSNLFIQLSGDTEYATLAQAQAAGVATFNYGNFIAAIINFIILAIVIFLFVKGINSLRDKIEKKPAETPKTKKCPYCVSEIDIKATKCPHCTSEIPAAQEEQ